MIISTMLSIHNVLLESLKSKIGILNAIMLAFDPLKMGGGHTTNQAFGLEMGGTKPRRCYVCNNVGHIAKLCPEAKQANYEHRCLSFTSTGEEQLQRIRSTGGERLITSSAVALHCVQAHRQNQRRSPNFNPL